MEQITASRFLIRLLRLTRRANHPDANIDWSSYEPISGIPGYDMHNRVPYTDEWMFSIERQAGPETVFSASYVGTASHRQRVLVEPNPGNPALCLSLSQPSEVSPARSPAAPAAKTLSTIPLPAVR